MRIALIAPPFIEVPPIRYGGTELFIANLANELKAIGHEVVVYANGDSTVQCRVKSIYPHSEWPIDNPDCACHKNVDHTAWAMADAAEWADVIHLNDIVGVPFTRFIKTPTVLTIHHPDEPSLSEQYCRYQDVHYIAIAQWLADRMPMRFVHVVHHGIDPNRYKYSADKDDYYAFLGRIAPAKGPHLAITAAKKAGVRLKVAGEIQPIFRKYWEEQVQPLVDGDQIQFIGEVDHLKKNTLLSRAKALLFPIQWEEPFGLVMIESMACGTPVIALPGGSVEEVVRNGVSGWICRDVDDMAARIKGPAIPSSACHDYFLKHFTLARMAEKYVSVYESVLDRSAEPLASAREA